MRGFVTTLVFCLSLQVYAIGQSTEQETASNRDEAKAILVPLLHHPMDGRISISNTGNAPAVPSKLTLDCVKLGVPIQMNSCPGLPVSAAAMYFDPMFPKNATIQVPTLLPGETFTHTLVFWNQLTWPSGSYRFTAVADAGHSVSQSATKRNIASSTLIVR